MAFIVVNISGKFKFAAFLRGRERAFCAHVPHNQVIIGLFSGFFTQTVHQKNTTTREEKDYTKL